MLIRHAELISELLTNAGWMDAPGELLWDIETCEGKEVAVAKAKEVLDLINDINAHLEVPINPKVLQEYIAEAE